MSMYTHRGMGGVPPPSNSTRLNELLEQIRGEFDGQARQSEGFEHQSKLCRSIIALSMEKNTS